MDRNPVSKDVRRMHAGRAHTDAHDGLTDREVSELHMRFGLSRRTWTRAKTKGFRGQTEMSDYMESCPNPMRIVVWAKTYAYQNLREKTDRELIESYRELLAYEPSVEAGDREHTVRRGIAWLDRAASSERDASVDEQKAAHERLFAERRLTEEQVFGYSMRDER